MKEFTVKESAEKIKLTTNSIHCRMRSRNVSGQMVNGNLYLNEYELEIISRKRNCPIDYATSYAIINRYLRSKDNQINRICHDFNVSEASVHRIINEHLETGYEILESKLNNPDFVL